MFRKFFDISLRVLIMNLRGRAFQEAKGIGLQASFDIFQQPFFKELDHWCTRSGFPTAHRNKFSGDTDFGFSSMIHRSSQCARSIWISSLFCAWLHRRDHFLTKRSPKTLFEFCWGSIKKKEVIGRRNPVYSTPHFLCPKEESVNSYIREVAICKGCGAGQCTVTSFLRLFLKFQGLYLSYSGLFA